MSMPRVYINFMRPQNPPDDLTINQRCSVAQELVFRNDRDMLLEGQVDKPSANKEAYERLKAHAKELEPLIYIVTEDIAAAVEPALMSLPHNEEGNGNRGFQRVTRQDALDLLMWFQQNQNWAKPKSQAVKDLGMPYVRYQYVMRYWPHFWSMLNVLVQKKFRDEQALVDLATLDAAIQGNDRDRRLYYELRGKLRRDPGEGAKATLIFINDSVQRPLPLEQRLEPLPGPSEQRLEPLPADSPIDVDFTVDKEKGAEDSASTP